MEDDTLTNIERAFNKAYWAWSQAKMSDEEIRRIYESPSEVEEYHPPTKPPSYASSDPHYNERNRGTRLGIQEKRSQLVQANTAPAPGAEGPAAEEATPSTGSGPEPQPELAEDRPAGKAEEHREDEEPPAAGDEEPGEEGRPGLRSSASITFEKKNTHLNSTDGN